MPTSGGLTHYIALARNALGCTTPPKNTMTQQTRNADDSATDTLEAATLAPAHTHTDKLDTSIASPAETVDYETQANLQPSGTTALTRTQPRAQEKW
eukprot:971808-Amphidinium_carterae.1